MGVFRIVKFLLLNYIQILGRPSRPSGWFVMPFGWGRPLSLFFFIIIPNGLILWLGYLWQAVWVVFFLPLSPLPTRTSRRGISIFLLNKTVSPIFMILRENPNFHFIGPGRLLVTLHGQGLRWPRFRIGSYSENYDRIRVDPPMVDFTGMLRLIRVLSFYWICRNNVSR